MCLSGKSDEQKPQETTAPPVKEITAKTPTDEARQKQIEEALVQMTSQNQDERATAIFALIELNAKEAIPDITKLLQDSDSEVRRLAVWALVCLDAKETIPQITKLLQDNDSEVRRFAVEALGKLGAKESIQELVKLLDDTNEDTRGFTAIVLVELGAKDKVPTKNPRTVINSSRSAHLNQILAVLRMMIMRQK